MKPSVQQRQVLKSRVTVEQHEPDWNGWEELASGVLERFGITQSLPRDPKALASFLADFWDRHVPRLGNVYANPAFTVRSSIPTPDFFRRARTLRLRWLMQAKSVLGRGLKRELKMWQLELPDIPRRFAKAVRQLVRELAFTGVMIVDGKLLAPGEWSTPDQDLIGRIFGRLTVVKALPRGRFLCRCNCGTDRIVRRQQLISGRTKSCGCLKMEVDKRRKARKLCRGC